MTYTCHGCGMDNDDAPDNVPFALFNHDQITIALCYRCIIHAAVQLREYLAGELEYRSWGAQ